MKFHRLDTDLQVAKPLAKNRIFDQARFVASYLTREIKQSIEQLLAAGRSAERRALVKQCGVGDNPAFVEFSDEVLSRHADVIEKDFVESLVAGHLNQGT